MPSTEANRPAQLSGTVIFFHLYNFIPLGKNPIIVTADIRVKNRWSITEPKVALIYTIGGIARVHIILTDVQGCWHFFLRYPETGNYSKCARVSFDPKIESCSRL